MNTENLQFIALKLSCKARSLYNEICLVESNPPVQVQPNAQRQKVNTSTMSAVADVLDALMTMLSWLDKPPYETPIPDEKNPYRVFSQW